MTIREILTELFYDTLNVEFNMTAWIRNLVKYGDFFLQLEILDKYGIVNIRPLSPYDVIRLEDHDPEDPMIVQFEVVSDKPMPGYRRKENIYENYEKLFYFFQYKI